MTTCSNCLLLSGRRNTTGRRGVHLSYGSSTYALCHSSISKKSSLFSPSIVHSHRIGVNISEQKSGTERTKKCKKREFVFCFTTRGRNRYCSTPFRRYTDFARATITRDIFNPGPTRNKQAKSHTFLQFCRAN